MRVLGLDKAEPARTAGCKHRSFLQLSGSKSLYELVRFLHDRKICGKGRIKHIVRSHFFQCIQDLSDRSILKLQPQFFRPCSTHSRRHLSHYDFFFIFDCLPDFLSIVPFTKRSDRTVCNTLSAQGTVCLFNVPVSCYIDTGS